MARLILMTHHPITRLSLALLGVGLIMFGPSSCDDSPRPGQW